MADSKLPRNTKPRNDLTADFVRTVLTYAPEAGVFRWRWRSDVGDQWNRRYAGKIAGSDHGGGYIGIGINGTIYLAHRLAWLYMTGEWPTTKLDHRFSVPDDNRRSELRKATDEQNAWNSKLSRRNTSGYKGVTWRRDVGRWVASIHSEGRLNHLGYFDDPEIAHRAYKEAAVRLRGPFARVE